MMKLNMTAVTLFSHADVSGRATDGVVVFETKKGQVGITAEGALFKGGAALRAMKDQALLSAGQKAMGGRYRAACDVILAAFPSVGRAFEALNITPWANKAAFQTLVASVRRFTPKEGKELSTKQRNALLFISALCTEIDGLAENVTADVIDAAQS